MSVLNRFDTWSSPFCTCGPKLSRDPYSGCPGGCAYCYAATYIWRYWGPDRVQPKRDLLRRLQRDLDRISAGVDPSLRGLQGSWVTLSNSSDPYPTVPQANEGELRLTRGAVGLLAERGFRVMIQTKSCLFARDLDVLPAGRATIGVTVTCLDAGLAARLEPGMPAPRERLAAVREAATGGLPVLVRIDPLIRGVNDPREDLDALVDAAALAGARHVVASTLKLQPRSRANLTAALPATADTLGCYRESQGRGGYRQLSLPERTEALAGLREMVVERGMSFAVCRESGLADLNTAACDGRDMVEASPRVRL